MAQSINSDKVCPLCQRLNACAVANKQSLEHCWCHQEVFPPKSTVGLSNQDIKACICQSCAERLLEEYQLGLKRVD
ncbi:cysteine-rich CWC family protein [Shewanella psychrotolerans]|uniref:cysteine-rich CWC family protein n=1 Tax=Shewanella psychrotolerans TaxID=2864206 RepID=UPI001C655E4D|nr:cysteine-rich CWC family protein [Shewanella psychrotolerans]QYK01902.1 cysteine-rich CWC family protein [Shewanella psychrotolerans]